MLPGNPRYQPKQLVPYFGYDNLYRAVAQVEIATMEVLAEIGVIPSETITHLTQEVKEGLLGITTTEVDQVERNVTNHDIRAWIHIAQAKVHPSLRRWMHIPLTSYDVLDTARSLQFLESHNHVVAPMTDNIIGHFAERARTYATQKQIGRTHGQHALPITVGFWFATTLSRILANIESANAATESVVGKISGAVGAYNAQVGLGISDRCGQIPFETRVLKKLGLKPARISTQIMPPEPLADYLWACLKLSATLGQFGRDGRHLMRSEIAELCEPFDPGQVGSSTMAHKRNPINFENLEGTWLKTKSEFGKVLDTLISEHQRDLVGSSLARDLPIIVVNLVSQLGVLSRESKKNPGKPFISRICIDPEACARNMKLQGDAVLAEPMYIGLQMAGYEGDAHDLINHHAMPRAKQMAISLLDAMRVVIEEKFPDAKGALGNIPTPVLEMLADPGKYTGLAKQQALRSADCAQKYLTSRCCYE